MLQLDFDNKDLNNPAPLGPGYVFIVDGLSKLGYFFLSKGMTLLPLTLLYILLQNFKHLVL